METKEGINKTAVPPTLDESGNGRINGVDMTNIAQLTQELNALGQTHPFRITFAEGRFVVELFDNGFMADNIGVGADSRFPVAYQKAVNTLEKNQEEKR